MGSTRHCLGCPGCILIRPNHLRFPFARGDRPIWLRRFASDNSALATSVDGTFPNLIAETQCPNACWATFSFVGYETVKKSCQAIEKNGGVVKLVPQAEALDAVVVTASITGSTVQEETVPVTVLKPYLAENGNALDLKGLCPKRRVCPSWTTR